MGRFTSFVLIALALSIPVVANSAEPGFVEGHINIGPLTSVLREGSPAPVVPPEVYRAYRITIFKADGKTAVTQVTPNSDGDFRQSLAPGTYILNMPRRPMMKVSLPQTITIVSGETVRADIEIDTGIR